MAFDIECDTMNTRRKLLASIRSNPRDVRFDDACRAAKAIGFVHQGGRGSHRTFSRTGERVILNFQNRDGRISLYQARQLIEMIDLYDGMDA